MRPEYACRITGDEGETVAIAFQKDAVSTKLKEDLDMAISHLLMDPYSSRHAHERMKMEYDHHRQMALMQHPQAMMMSESAARAAGILGVDMGAPEKNEEKPKAQPQQALNNKLLLLL